MKNILQFFTVSSLLITFFNVIPSEESQWLDLPKEITQHNVVCYLKHPDIAALKQTSTQCNKIFDYDILHTDTIAAIDEVVCTKIICHLARAAEEKNFLHFYKNNNTEKRNQALRLLGWEIDANNTQQLMEVHCKGIHAHEEALALEPGDIINAWSAIYNNKIALTIFYLSDHPNIKNYYGDTFLIWASLSGKEEAVKLFLSHPNINVNAQNNNGITALMVACNGCYTEIVKHLLAHPKINAAMVSDGKYGRPVLSTALHIASSRARTDNSYNEIVALLDPNV